MKKTLTNGLMIVLSAAVLSACGANSAPNAASLGGSDNAFNQLSVKNQYAASADKDFHNKMGTKQGGHAGAEFAFGFLNDLSLTDAQKTEIQSIMEAAKANQPHRPSSAQRPAAPDAAAMEAVQAKISAAFVSDSFDADALQTELKSLHPEATGDRPDPAVMELSRAQQTLDVWNVLTAEQKATVTTKAAEHAVKGSSQGLAQITEKLSLSADQQAALSATFETSHPAVPTKSDHQALITLLNSGSATSESIAALHTRPEKVDFNPLTALATLHNVLTAEQRQAFVDNGLLKQAGRGGSAGDHKGGSDKGAMKDAMNKGYTGGHHTMG